MKIFLGLSDNEKTDEKLHLLLEAGIGQKNIFSYYFYMSWYVVVKIPPTKQHKMLNQFSENIQSGLPMDKEFAHILGHLQHTGVTHYWM